MPTGLAVLSAGLGDTVETFAWLRRALEGRDPFLIYNYVSDPIMAPFRRDPRGQAILRGVGLGAGNFAGHHAEVKAPVRRGA